MALIIHPNARVSYVSRSTVARGGANGHGGGGGSDGPFPNNNGPPYVSERRGPSGMNNARGGAPFQAMA
jgi:hypothetical protein